MFKPGDKVKTIEGDYGTITSYGAARNTYWVTVKTKPTFEEDSRVIELVYAENELTKDEQIHPNP